MGGMSRSLQLDNPLVVSAFHAALLHQLLVVLAVGGALALAWNVVVTLGLRRAGSAGGTAVTGGPDAVQPGEPGGSSAGAPTSARVGPGAAMRVVGEPPARHVVRVAFGLLWLVDGLLQVQSAMPLGMPTGVVRPAASGSPGWVHAVVNAGMTIWADHPVEAAASIVWIQVGIGLALLLAPRGWWSRAAGGASIGWALVVWVFGEAFGGLFGHGASWLFGAPGAVVYYAAAGALLALPERAWRGPRIGRLAATVTGAFLLGMAILQAWPGRGSWHGGHGAHAGSVVSMVRAMAHNPQPHLLSSWLSSFASFDAAHGWAVNLFVVVVLAGSGAALCSGRRLLVLAGAGAVGLLSLATWVLVQDFGVLGGVGTDPNSMLPLLCLLAAVAVATLRAPAEAADPSFLPVHEMVHDGSRRRAELRSPAVLGRVAGIVLAAAVLLVGAVPMAAAAMNPRADPLVTEALNGTPDFVDSPAPSFALVDQHGRPVSLESLHGRVIALTFLDPVCTSDCPLVAQSFRQADQMLGDAARRTVFVAIAANPVYHSVAALDAFDRQERLDGMRNWLFLTGSLAQLTRVWNAYGIQVAIAPAGAMVLHSDTAFIIDGRGRIRVVLGTDPGVTASAHASMSTLVSDELRSVLSR